MQKVSFSISLFLCFLHVNSQNPPEQEKWLQDAGFGMFIHWNVDVQLGTVISHTLVGASEDYVNRYFNELPKTFNPADFDAERFAVLAKLAGMKYMVFTAKHHSGFCMWHTNTTGFNIKNTPYGEDIMKKYTDACRKHGLKVGLYFSPEDFLFLHENGELIRRTNIEKISDELKGKYIQYLREQCTELLTNYGTIDILFFDGGEFMVDALKSHVRKLNPEILITRGEIPTPEQHLPGVGSGRVWESCITMGTQWAFKPTNEEFKTGGQLIRILAETRAKGGALLLNVGPDPYGTLPFEQDRNLREVAAWYFINQEAVDNVRPWIVTNEENIWFTKQAENNTVYAILFLDDPWERGTRREFTLHSVKAGENTVISVLGQNDKIVEYQPGVDPVSRFEQTDEGLKISVVRAQRIYNNHQWPNPIVVKLQNVEPALVPPRINTLPAPDIDTDGVTMMMELLDLGDARRVQLAFQYRLLPQSLNMVGEMENWKQTGYVEADKPGNYPVHIKDIQPGKYQFRAIAKHPGISIKGEILQFNVKEERK